jgi:hypothetical protein
VINDGADLSSVPIGLLSQIELFKFDYKSKPLLGLLSRIGLLEIDAIINVGGNDIINAFTTGGLASSGNKWKYGREFADSIIDNITGAVDKISPFVDQVVVFGMPPLDETPLAESAEKVVRGAKRFFAKVTQRVNQDLEWKYDSPFFDNPDVLVIDSIDIFDQVKALDQVFFVDDLHPTEVTNQFSAGFIADNILSAMPGFGFPI